MKNRHSVAVAIIFLIAATTAGCRKPAGSGSESNAGRTHTEVAGAIIVAENINYDVVVNPPQEGDPWQIERVSGYAGKTMIDDLFEKLYSGTLTARHITTGEPLNAQEIKNMEKELGSDRSLIGKIQFTEDWYYHPSTARIEKVVKEIILGYEFRDSQGNHFGYKALFSITPGN